MIEWDAALPRLGGRRCVCLLYTSQKNITILFENEDYILVPSKTTTGENEVKLFDEIVVRGTDPVSYTHLDVYKRQA